MSKSGYHKISQDFFFKTFLGVLIKFLLISNYYCMNLEDFMTMLNFGHSDFPIWFDKIAINFTRKRAPPPLAPPTVPVHD